MYEGTKVRLRRLEQEDVQTIMSHWNEYELRQYLPTPLPTTKEEMENYIDAVNAVFAQKKGFTFGIG